MTATVLGVAGCAVPLSSATSPDGRWTVKVKGQPMIFGLGGMEVSMRATGPEGRTRSSGVIDLCDWSDARKRYRTIDITNERAVAGDQTLRFEDQASAETSPND